MVLFLDSQKPHINWVFTIFIHNFFLFLTHVGSYGFVFGLPKSLIQIRYLSFLFIIFPIFNLCGILGAHLIKGLIL